MAVSNGKALQQAANLQGELGQLRTRLAQLVQENVELRRYLARYGDHTVECYHAPTERCICGWVRLCRELHLSTAYKLAR
jgi:hypothetical protein